MKARNRAVCALGVCMTILLLGGYGAVPVGAKASSTPKIPKSLVKAACKEGALTLYQLDVNPAVTHINESFESAYPCITVNAVQGVGGTILTRFQASQASGPEPDYLELSLSGTMVQLAQQGAFKTFTPIEAKTVDTLDPGLVYADFFLQMGVMYNTTTVSASMISHLKTWADIDSSAFDKLNIGFVSPAAGGTAETAFYYLTHVLGKTFVKKFIATHHITIFPSAQPAAAAVASGQVDMILPEASNGALAEWAAGAPVRYAIPSPGIQTATAIAIPKGALHPAAAELYEDYVLGPTGQGFYNVDDFARPSNTKVPNRSAVTLTSWWKVPKVSYKYNPVTVNADSPNLITYFTSITGGA